MAQSLVSEASSLTPDPQILLEEAGAIFQQHGKVRCVAYRTSGGWAGQDTVLLNGLAVLVRVVTSPLEARMALQELSDPGLRLVLLTAVDEHELGQDVLARLYKQRLVVLRAWDIVRTRLKVLDIDPELLANPHLAGFLLDALRRDSNLSTPNAILTADFAWEFLFEKGFGLPRNALSGIELLKSTTMAHLPEAVEAADTLYQAARTWLLQRGADLSAAVLHCIRTGQAQLCIPIGIACGMVFSRPEPELAAGAARLEPYLGSRLTPSLAEAWSKAAHEVLDNLPTVEQRAWREQADELLIHIGLERWAWLEPWSLLGEEQRLGHFADTLLKNASLPATETALADVLECPLLSKSRRSRCEMAGRLKRWLAGTPSNAKTSLADAATGYIEHGSLVDLARHALRQEEPGQKIATAYQRLLEEVSTRREESNQRFGELLATWSQDGAPMHGVLGVENVIANVVSPLVRSGSRVLLLVLDGLSWPVAQALLSDFEQHGWNKVERKFPLPPVLAAFPTITECSRASLLAGSLVKGQAAFEKAQFKDQPELRALVAKAPRLFHKGDLPPVGLSDEIREVIQDDAHKVVGVVLNTVDDTLAKDDQLHIVWKIESIRPLPSLLSEARRARRVIVLASDHGHILDEGTELRSHGGAARWTEATHPPEPDEILLTGPRVLQGNGRVIAPWSEKVRYAGRHCGYHGGVTPQEALPPLLVLSPLGTVPKGWTAVPLRKPDWWDPNVSRLRPSVAKKSRKGPQLELALEPRPGDDVIDTLLGSVDRKVDANTVAARKVLAALLSAGVGEKVALSTLAQIADMPEQLLDDVLQRINRGPGLDGSRVIGVQSGSAVLDREAVQQAVGGRSGELPAHLLTLLSEQETRALELLIRYRTVTEGQLKRELNSHRVSGLMANLVDKLSGQNWRRIVIEEAGAEGHLYIFK